MTVTLRSAFITVLILVIAGGLTSPAVAQIDALPEGVTAKEVWFYSEGVACYGRIFFPPGYSESGSRAAVVLANGWTGTAPLLERYAQRFAARGLVAMAIDYRGWGKSGGFATLAEPIKSDDRLRIQQTIAKVRLKRTRLIPNAQVDDIKAAISYLQGEPGVDRGRIGLWGTSYAGGHVVSIAAIDPRVKVGVAQVPAIAGHGQPMTPVPMSEEARQDWIMRARTGTGATQETGFGETTITIDLETTRLAAEYRPFQALSDLPDDFPLLFIVAENDELIDNATHAHAASALITGATQVIEIPGITHFEVYRGEPFETSVRAAADWFVQFLGGN